MKVSFAEKLKKLFGSKKTESEEFFEDLTDALIEGDIGAKNAVQIVDELETKCREEKITDQEKIFGLLKEIILSGVKEVSFKPEEGKVNVWMILGVNGVGKTTSVAKMAKLFKDKGNNVVMAASDTFRAAAVDQLSMHGERLGIRVVKHQMGSDPSAVVFDAAQACDANGGGLVLCDTAGRLHNKKNLMNELNKITRVIRRELPEADVETLMVLDATTGQNGLIQAKQFLETAGVTGIVLTKLDGTAKGGIVFAIANELKLPVKYVGVGEGIDDLIPFNPKEFVEALFK